MAKKKTKSSNLGLILKVVVLVLGVAAFCMAFLTCVKFVNSDGDLVNSFTGFQEMFGYKETETLPIVGTEVTTEYLLFGFMALLTFLLPLIGAVLTLLNNKIVRFVGVALMLVGGVLMFFVPNFAMLANVDTALSAGSILDACTRTLGIGAILGGVFSLLGGLVAGYAVLTKK